MLVTGAAQRALKAQQHVGVVGMDVYMRAGEPDEFGHGFDVVKVAVGEQNIGQAQP